MNTYVIIGEGSGEITEKKSRFIASIKEVHSENEANEFLETIRKRYWDCRHNCYAYVVGKNNELQRFSDDKEPSGTAGRPILDVLLGSGIRNCMVVVTRYFGGILLGTGGLVRAYSSSAQTAIEAVRSGASTGKILPVYEGFKVSFKCEYKDIGRFDGLLAKFEAGTISIDYGEKAGYTAALDGSNLEPFVKEAVNITCGAFELESRENITFCREGNGVIFYEF